MIHHVRSNKKHGFARTLVATACALSSMACGSGSDEGNGATTTGGQAELTPFSFFVTSQAGLRELSDSDQGFGGELTYGQAIGIAGADLICETLAERSMPGSAVKVWKAFLSTTEEDAIDRVGQGPWFDRQGRQVASGVAGLTQERPDAEASIVNDLPNEHGIPNSTPDGEKLTNHDTMTASDDEGRLLVGGASGSGFSNCQDWTSAEGGQEPPVMGHSWPAASGQSWVNVGRHATGCEALIQTGPEGCAGSGVGCGGGYGGFYCFALSP